MHTMKKLLSYLLLALCLCSQALAMTSSIAATITARQFTAQGTGNASTAIANKLGVHWTADTGY